MLVKDLPMDPISNMVFSLIGARETTSAYPKVATRSTLSRLVIAMAIPGMLASLILVSANRSICSNAFSKVVITRSFPLTLLWTGW